MSYDFRNSNNVTQSTTEPNTPERVEQAGGEIEDESSPSGDFARLYPRSIAARLAFHNLAVTVELDPETYGWQRRFLHLRDEYEELESSHEAGSSTDEHDEQGKTPEQEKQLVRTGFWRLNLGIPPALPHIGWMLGKGRWKNHAVDSHGAVDILLTNNGHEQSLRGRHARLIHNLESNIFVIIAIKKLRFGAGYLEPGEIAAFSSKRTTIAMGDFEYSLEYTDLERGVYRAQLDEMSRSLGYTGQRPAEFINPTPGDTDYALKDKYIIQGSFARGSSCFVCWAVDKTGAAFAVKKIIALTRGMREAVKQEADTMRRITHSGRAPSSICRFIEYISIEPSNPSGATECFIITQPVITQTLAELLLVPSFPMSSRLILFEQMVEGLEFLHRQGCMHRDIKPGNIVASSSPLQAVIIDLGAATWETCSTDHMKGTIRYLAPEIIAMKRGRAPKDAKYTNRADIWGIGLTSLELFTGYPCRWNEISRSSHELMLSREAADESDVWAFEVAKKMISWDPDKRISAETAITIIRQHKAISLDDTGDQVQPGGKRVADSIEARDILDMNKYLKRGS